MPAVQLDSDGLAALAVELLATAAAVVASQGGKLAGVVTKTGRCQDGTPAHNRGMATRPRADWLVELENTRLVVERVLLRWAEQPVPPEDLLSELSAGYQALWPVWWDDTGRLLYEGAEWVPEQTAGDERPLP